MSYVQSKQGFVARQFWSGVLAAIAVATVGFFGGRNASAELVTSGLQMHLDASEYSSLTLNGSDEVLQWADLVVGDGSRDAKKVEDFYGGDKTGYRPQYVIGSNGLGMITFDGSDALISNYMPAYGAGARTFMIAVEAVGNTGFNSQHVLHYGKPYFRQAYGIMSSVWAGSPSRTWGQHFWGDGYTSGINSQSTAEANGFVVFRGYDGTVDHSGVNGSTLYDHTVTLNTQEQWVEGGIHLGTRIDLPWGNLTETAQFTIGEVLVYDRYLTSEEREQNEAYLATKWGYASLFPEAHSARAVPEPSSIALLAAGGLAAAMAGMRRRARG